jgi:hypothetical protein
MSKRKISKPATAKPATAKAAPAAKPETTTATAPRVPANITRTIATVERGACNFGGTISDRDNAYFGFYKQLIAANGGKLTVAAIVASGRKPAYNGSAKPHDAGVIQRLGKAGLLAGTGSESAPLTLTARGQSTKA